jgi:hypothetical protein
VVEYVIIEWVSLGSASGEDRVDVTHLVYSAGQVGIGFDGL